MIKPSNPFILAPMAGITDMPFRRLMKQMGAGCVISEFVSAHALIRGSKKREKYLAYHEDERPVGIQLFGDDAESLAEASKIVEGTGVDFVDINLGCPVPKVVKKGGGSAWLTRTDELGQMLSTIKSAINIPLTIKIRTGWDSNQINAEEVSRIAKEEGVEWVAIHGRTRTQGYSGHANWQIIRDVAKVGHLPIIGNGDIVSGPLAAARLLESGNFGVMIGRGALKNPWIFQEACEAWEKMQGLDEAAADSLVQEVLSHHQLPGAGDLPEGRHYYERKVKKLQPAPVDFSAEWIRIRADRDAKTLIEDHLGYLYDMYPEERVKFGFRKFLAWYSAGYPGSKEFRKFIFNHEHFPDLINRALEFFDEVKQLGDGSDEFREAAPVLMSGHG
ncbi:tRNA-dihydrouridine synthase family protein [bacterium]|nr:tRNA-dihydrouridine synthase family protein [bacterium]